MPKLQEYAIRFNRDTASRFYECCDEVTPTLGSDPWVSLANLLNYDIGNLFSIRDDETRVVPLYVLVRFVNLYPYSGTWILSGIGSKKETKEVVTLPGEWKDILLDVKRRYFKAVEDLMLKKRLDSINELAIQLNVARGNLYTIRRSDDKNVQSYMCSHIVEKYRINGTWLLTGVGNMYR